MGHAPLPFGSSPGSPQKFPLHGCGSQTGTNARGPATRPEVERTIQLHPSDVRTGDQATQSPGSGVTWALNGRPWHAPLSHRSQALESGDQGGRGPWAQESRRLGPGRWAALAAGPQTWRTNVFRLQPLQSTQHLLWAPELARPRISPTSPLLPPGSLRGDLVEPGAWKQRGRKLCGLCLPPEAPCMSDPNQGPSAP